MRPAFSNALYYPTIDIRNVDWLKTAILFWDSISTIVPESLNNPYRQHDTQYLADIGFLRPLRVNPNSRSVVGIEEDSMALLSAIDAVDTKYSTRAARYSGIFNDGSSYRVMEHLRSVGIYIAKMPERFYEKIQQNKSYRQGQRIFYFPEEIAYAYMIALASRLCDDYSLGMVTDDLSCFDLGNRSRYGNLAVDTLDDSFCTEPPNDHQFEQGLLLNFLIKDLSISPDTPLTDIVAFKNHHKDELGRFRTQLARLTQDISVDKPIAIIQQEISDLYNNEFMPAWNDFKAALKSSRIKWFSESCLKVALLSIGATSIPMTILGMQQEQAILAGVGVSVMASAISYKEERKRFLRENPYSYLLSIEREWK